MATRTGRVLGWAAVAWAVVFFLGAGFRVLADCASFGLPFTDLGSEPGFCAAIAEAYYAGITNGTSPATFSPNDNVTRVQAAALSTRTLDASLTRGSRRAALGQWWTSTPHYDQGLGLTHVGLVPLLLASDGADIWVPNEFSGTVSRVRASDGKVLETWTGASRPYAVLIAMGRVFVTGSSNPGVLYMIDPSQTAGAVAIAADTLGAGTQGVAFDGNRIWTANFAGSISIITPGTWDVTTVSTGMLKPLGMLFDGNNVWVTDNQAGTLLKLDANGLILQTIEVGSGPWFPGFDGKNIWVPSFSSDSLTVVRASDGAILKTYSAANGNQNGLSSPVQAAFDGQRVLVTNGNGGLSLFRATDLEILGSVLTTGLSTPEGVCSDGLNFWVSFSASGAIGRF